MGYWDMVETMFDREKTMRTSQTKNKREIEGTLIRTKANQTRGKTPMNITFWNNRNGDREKKNHNKD